jgi:hypothetical protein
MPIIPPAPNPIYYVPFSGLLAITDALDLLGANDVSETPDSATQSRDLRTLNMMLDAWNTERLIPYAMTQFSGTLVPGQQSYVIGALADFNTTLRPPKISNGEAWLRVNGVDQELQSDSVEEWAAIPVKTNTGIPSDILYTADKITATIQFYPVPDQAWAFLLWQRTLLAQIQDVGTIYYLPPGYAEAITNHLAIRLAPKHGKPVPPEVELVATNAKAAIKRLNKAPQKMVADTSTLGPGRYDIYTGTIR